MHAETVILSEVKAHAEDFLRAAAAAVPGTCPVSGGKK
jgi:hypothetical protein